MILSAHDSINSIKGQPQNAMRITNKRKTTVNYIQYNSHFGKRHIS